MLKLKRVQRKTWITVGIALALLVIGVGGCGTNSAASTQSAAQSSSDSSATADKSAQGQTSQKPTLNPAIQAAMEVRRLQGSQDMVLTSEQKTTIKPLLQSLIDTTNPSEDLLKQKAAAIEAAFTDKQKSYLSTQEQKGRPDANGKANDNTKANTSGNGDSQNGQDQSNGQPKTQPNDQASGSNKSAPSFNAQDIYKQALNSLT